MTKNALLIADHLLDPRLRKRLAWIKKIYENVEIYTDHNRGKHFSDKNIPEKKIEDIKITSYKDKKLVYVSGNKVILDQFFNLLYSKYINKSKIIYEIPDLPLRSKHKIVDFAYSLIYNTIIKILFDTLIITSEAYKKYLPKNKLYCTIENINLDILSGKKIINIDDNSSSQKKTIGYIGVIRYMDQLKMLVDYCSEHDLEIKIYGGPPNKANELIKYGEKINKKINYYGEYEQNQLEYIYNEIDAVYSVYDGNQKNVLLALPNKLYEAIFFQKPIIVAKNTFLAEKVKQLNCGIEVNSLNYNEFKKEMEKLWISNYKYDIELIKKEEEKNQENFIKLLRSN